MTDTEFARAFERLAVSPDDFNHRGHLRVAWVYLEEAPSIAAASVKMARAIKRFAASVGKPDKYSAAITVSWMHRLAAARQSMPGASLDAVLTAHPRLLQPNDSQAR